MQVVDPGKKNAAEAAIGEKLGKQKSGVSMLANRSGHFTFPAVSRSLVGDAQYVSDPWREWSGAISNSIRADAENEII